MDLTTILDDFYKTKIQIREGTLFRIPTTNKYDGLSMAVAYSEVIEYVVKNLFDLTSESILNWQTNGIGAFLYGSPGRREMVCESDLDILLIYKDNSQIYSKFKEQFKKLAQPFKFCKIDLPEWGNIEEVSTFSQKSITEGNQVLECRFICGDKEIANSVKNIQEKYGGPDRMIRNIIFQNFYFQQYFRQRVRNGKINVKYCDGGSRDYLFINWFNQLMNRKYPEWNKTFGERPVAEIGLSNIYKNGLISSLEFGRAIEALNFNILFRNEILLANKGTEDEGLTLLDEKTLKNVLERIPELLKEFNIYSPTELQREFDKQRLSITKIKERIWNLMIEEHGKEIGDKNWAKYFKQAYSQSTEEKERGEFMQYEDTLMKIALIWGASNSNQINLLNKIAEKEKNSESWEIQASLTTSPNCSPEYLQHIGMGIGKEKGYGYILRIISRNQNVNKETLESIANDEKVELRYKQCAKAALKYGKEVSNHQI